MMKFHKLYCVTVVGMVISEEQWYFRFHRSDVRRMASRFLRPLE